MLPPSGHYRAVIGAAAPAGPPRGSGRWPAAAPYREAPAADGSKPHMHVCSGRLRLKEAQS
ncbi:hypothetical protein FsymDg_3038 [Candidatus Protofrankia datiscae]|uniref:Uncharacterized protein n=1 Tax=Candidatus Protofrankia datiscae TaxID=2716812 RepID=F8AXJ9_9ACTN|nr:hypothetical protein FsymDg_3038 [Candidatus Protofrankia datiscae]